MEAESRYIEIVKGVRLGHEHAIADLHTVFVRSARTYVLQRLGPQDAEDRLHDSFIIVLRAIQDGRLNQADHLMSYIFTVIRRQTTRCTFMTIHRRNQQVALDENAQYVNAQFLDAEGNVMQNEQRCNVRSLLGRLSPKDREVLTRFYLREQAKEVVCEQMRLTATQFRLLKNRAKLHFAELQRQMDLAA